MERLALWSRHDDPMEDPSMARATDQEDPIDWIDFDLDFDEVKELSFADLENVVYDIDIDALFDYDVEEFFDWDVDDLLDWSIDDLFDYDMGDLDYSLSEDEFNEFMTGLNEGAHD